MPGLAGPYTLTVLVDGQDYASIYPFSYSSGVTPSECRGVERTNTHKGGGLEECMLVPLFWVWLVGTSTQQQLTSSRLSRAITCVR